MLFPEDLRCPISLELMADPVILPSGHSFDRSSIQRWLDAGNRTCPVSKQLLPQKPDLVPNHALRSLIHRFLDPKNPKNGPDPLDRVDLIGSLNYPAELSLLDRIRARSAADSEFRRRLLESGKAAAVLLRHAGGDTWQVQEAALRAVLELSLHGDEARVGLVADGAVDALVSALAGGSPRCQALAATAITSLAMLQVNKCTIGGHPGAIPELVQVLRKGKGRERKEAATALYVLCSFKENRSRCIRSGAVPVLASLADEGLDRAIELLELIGKVREGREAMEKEAGLIGIMARALVKGSERGVDGAMSLLGLLCRNSQRARTEAVAAGVWEICRRMGKTGAALVELLDAGDRI